MSTLPPLPPPPLYDAVLMNDGKFNDSWQKWISLLQIIIQQSTFNSVSSNMLIMNPLESADIPGATDEGIVLYMKKSDGNLYAKNSSNAEYKITSF